jgi:hypothetical protein
MLEGFRSGLGQTILRLRDDFGLGGAIKATCDHPSDFIEVLVPALLNKASSYVEYDSSVGLDIAIVWVCVHQIDQDLSGMEGDIVIPMYKDATI